MLRTALPVALLVIAVAGNALSQDGVFEMRRTPTPTPTAQNPNVNAGKAAPASPTVASPEPPPAPAVSRWRDLPDTPTITMVPPPEASAPPRQQPEREDSATTETAEGTHSTVPKVGFVDVERVLDRSRAIREIMREVDREMAEEAARIDGRRRDAQRLRIQLEQQGAVLSESQRQARQQEIIDILGTVDEMEYRYRRKMEDRQRSTVEPLLQQIIEIIGDVGRREKFDLIVRGETVLYGRNNADLTQEVVAEVDKRAAALREAVLPAPTAAPGQQPPRPLPMVP